MGFLGQQLGNAVKNAKDKRELREEQCVKIIKYFEQNEDAIFSRFQGYPGSTFEDPAKICEIDYIENDELDKILSFLPKEGGFVIIDGFKTKFYCSTERGLIIIRNCVRKNSTEDSFASQTYEYNNTVETEHGRSAGDIEQEKLDDFIENVTEQYNNLKHRLKNHSASVDEISDLLSTCNDMKGNACHMFKGKKAVKKMESTMFDLYGTTLEQAKLMGYSEFDEQYSDYLDEIKKIEAKQKEEKEAAQIKKEEQRLKQEQEKAEREARLALESKIDEAQAPIKEKENKYSTAVIIFSVLTFPLGTIIGVIIYKRIKKWANNQLSIIEETVRKNNDQPN